MRRASPSRAGTGQQVKRYENRGNRLPARGGQPDRPAGRQGGGRRAGGFYARRSHGLHRAALSRLRVFPRPDFLHARSALDMQPGATPRADLFSVRRDKPPWQTMHIACQGGCRCPCPGCIFSYAMTQSRSSGRCPARGCSCAARFADRQRSPACRRADFRAQRPATDKEQRLHTAYREGCPQAAVPCGDGGTHRPYSAAGGASCAGAGDATTGRAISAALPSRSVPSWI